MNDVKKALFRLDDYKITDFSFSMQRLDSESLKVGFSPSGLFIEKNSQFKLGLVFTANEGEGKDEREIIRVRLLATFCFSEKIKAHEIPVYLYRNAIAIVFPYLRAFISTMTLQAGIELIILPVLNLSALEEELKSNTVFQ
jgi:preprotein translocase subunit SecB